MSVQSPRATPFLEAVPLKNYRCVFNFGRGRTTIDIVAHNAAGAMTEAQLTVQGDPVTIEVWDETGLVLERNPARADGRSPTDEPNR